MNLRKLLLTKISLLLSFGVLMAQQTSSPDTPIILVTFGSTYEAPQATFKYIEENVKLRFPKRTIQWAYTSSFIIKRLRNGQGKGLLKGQKININTPENTITSMIEDGFKNIAVQSLHVIPGEEYDEILEAIERIEEKYEGVEIAVGKPLLYTDADIAKVAEVMAAKFATEIATGPVLFMGHGTPHEADGQYAKLEAELQKINANFFVGTVEGIGFGEGENEGKGPNAIGSIVTKLDALSLAEKAVTITPLMSIVGDHANNDMNSDEEDSWRNVLETAGYTVTAVMKGLGDYAEINNIWLSHLESAK